LPHCAQEWNIQTSHFQSLCLKWRWKPFSRYAREISFRPTSPDIYFICICMYIYIYIYIYIWFRRSSAK
jgi:hypothetical protein